MNKTIDKKDVEKITFRLKDIKLFSIFNEENMNYGEKINLVKKEDLKEEDKLPIFSDTFFKAIFSNTNRLKYICKFLSYYLEDVTVEELLEIITLVKNEEDKTNESDKARRVDLLAQVGNMKINLEVNNCGTKEMMERNIEYICRIYGEQSKSGEQEKHDFCIAFNLNNFTPKDGKDFDVWGIKDNEGNLVFDKFIIFQIYLPALENKFENIYNKDVDKLTERERFLLMLSTSNKEESDKFCVKGDKIMKDYQKEASKVSHDKAVLDKYTKEWELEQMSIEREAIGERRGIEQGISQTQREVAEAMLQENLDIEMISRITKLSKEEIEEIKNTLK